MEGNLGQDSRSRPLVKGQGHEVKNCAMGHSIDFQERGKDETQEYNQ